MRGRILLLAGVGALASLAITAAVALPSRSAATAPVRVALPPVADQGAIIPPHEAEAPQPAADIGARRFAGRVGADMSHSLLAAGVPERQGREYIALLARAIDLAGGLTVDDRFDLVIERTPDGKLARLLYAGLDRVGRADVELLKWTDGKQVIWVNADGVGGENSQGMRMPVSGRVTSGFGERFHPILGYQRFHAGLDLAATFGSPIAAAADGRVVSAGWHGGYGRLVAVMHGGGIETLYGHMSQIAARPGETGPPGPGDRLCRLVGPVDRPAPPLRGPEERPPGKPAVGQARGRPGAARRREAARLPRRAPGAAGAEGFLKNLRMASPPVSTRVAALTAFSQSFAVKKVWLVIFAVALALRLVALSLTWGRGYVGDPAAYMTLAHNLIAGHGFGLFGHGMEQKALFPPLYPLLLAAVGSVFPLNQPTIFALNFAIDLAAAWVIAQLARELGFQTAPGRGDLPPVAEQCPVRLNPGQGRPDISSLCPCRMVRGQEGTCPFRACVRPASLTQPGLATLPAFFAILLRVPILVSAGIAALVMLPWWIRNYIVLGTFVPLTTASGASLWEGTFSPNGYWLVPPKRLLVGDELRFSQVSAA